jgi:hypothetical protein
MSPKRPFDMTTSANDAPPPKSRLTVIQDTLPGLAPTYGRTSTSTETDKSCNEHDQTILSLTQNVAPSSPITVAVSMDTSNDNARFLISPVESFDPMQFAKPTAIPIHRERMRKSWASSKAIHKSKISSLRLIQKAANSFYHYRRLKNNQVRLLVIKPAPDAPSDPLNATLMIIDDKELQKKDCNYAALSYNWGDSSADQTLFVQDNLKSQPINSVQDLVNGAMAHNDLRSRQLLIRPNLHEALRQLRRASRDKYLFVWVDALCIDQNDEVEKQEQVLKMAQIYRNATNVCIWLGSDQSGNNVSDMAMKFIPEAIQPAIHHALLTEARYISKWASLFELLRWSW